MRAIGVHDFGGPDALTVVDLPEPHAGPGEVRIRVRAAAVNPTDVGIRVGDRDFTGRVAPHIPGMDAAGVIDEVGPGSRWRLGQAVMAVAMPLTPHGGAYAELLVAPDDSLARIPSGTSLEEAATLPMNSLTATQILELAALRPGQTLAVTGAAGLLGNYLVQLAKIAGLTVVADAAPADRHLVRGLGADHVVARGDDVAARVRALYPDGVDAVADAAMLHDLAVPAVRDHGVFVSVRGWLRPTVRQIRFTAALVNSEYHAAAKLDAVRLHVEAGRLTPRLADVLAADQAPQAHRRLEAGGLRGRIVLTF